MMGCLPSSSTVSPHHDGVKLEMHSEAMIMQTWRSESSESGDAPGGSDRAHLEMHWEAVIVRTWRPKSSEFW